MEDVCTDNLEDVLQCLMDRKDWDAIYSFMRIDKECRDIVRQKLQRTSKWDPHLLDQGKVSLDRMAVICALPELRERAVRYVQGKSKFAYKTVVLQVNHPRDIGSLYITCNSGKMHLRTTTEEYHERCEKGRPKVSLRRKRDGRWGADIPWQDVRDALMFVSKLKQNIPASIIYDTMDIIVRTSFVPIARTRHAAEGAL